MEGLFDQSQLCRAPCRHGGDLCFAGANLVFSFLVEPGGQGDGQQDGFERGADFDAVGRHEAAGHEAVFIGCGDGAAQGEQAPGYGVVAGLGVAPNPLYRPHNGQQQAAGDCQGNREPAGNAVVGNERCHRHHDVHQHHIPHQLVHARAGDAQVEEGT